MDSYLFGMADADLSRAGSLIERIVDIRLEMRDSYYRGGDYYLWKGTDVELTLQLNYDCLDEDLAEEDFPDSKILVYLSGSERAHEIASLLRGAPELRLLRSKSYGTS